MDSNFSFKYYHPTRLILLIIILSIILGWVIHSLIGLALDLNIEYYQFTPTTIVIGIVIGVLIDKHLHKNKFLWGLLMKAPLIRGTYFGKMRFSRNNVPEAKNCRLLIYQTSSTIKVNCYFWPEGEEETMGNGTGSHSIVEEIELPKNEIPELHFYYYSHDVSQNRREGYNILKIYEDGKLLKGHYFSSNSLSDGNGGRIAVEFKSRKIKH